MAKTAPEILAEEETKTKLFAVGHFSHFTNELSLELVKATDWQSAVRSCSLWADTVFEGESLEDWKREAFDSDQGLDVKEVPNAN